MYFLDLSLILTCLFFSKGSSTFTLIHKITNGQKSLRKTDIEGTTIYCHSCGKYLTQKYYNRHLQRISHNREYYNIEYQTIVNNVLFKDVDNVVVTFITECRKKFVSFHFYSILSKYTILGYPLN